MTWLPLREDVRARFNEKAAQEFFSQTEGLPYGYHNFLYGWIDTAKDNWPPLLPSELVPIAFAVLEKVIPKTAFMFFTEALNKRLGTSDLDIEGIAAVAAERHMSV